MSSLYFLGLCSANSRAESYGLLHDLSPPWMDYYGTWKHKLRKNSRALHLHKMHQARNKTVIWKQIIPGWNRSSFHTCRNIQNSRDLENICHVFSIYWHVILTTETRGPLRSARSTLRAPGTSSPQLHTSAGQRRHLTNVFTKVMAIFFPVLTKTITPFFGVITR